WGRRGLPAGLLLGARLVLALLRLLRRFLWRLRSLPLALVRFLIGHQISASQRLHTLALTPSSIRWPTRVRFPHARQTSWTLDRSTKSSFWVRPPVIPPPVRVGRTGRCLVARA